MKSEDEALNLNIPNWQTRIYLLGKDKVKALEAKELEEPAQD